MNRDQKSSVIETLKNDFSQSQASFLVGVKGLTVKQVQALRKELRSKGGTLRVAKARLMKRAVDGVSGVEELAPYFKDQVGLVFAPDRMTEIAKLLTDFSKENQGLQLVVGCMDQALLPKDKIVKIASLPSREVLLAQVGGVMNMVVAKLLWTLNAVGEKKQQ